MDLRKIVTDDKVSLQIAPLIDVVFLLLVYFMVTASLVKKEADLSFLLPAPMTPATPVDLPIEVVIEISLGGDVVAEGMLFRSADRNLNSLATLLARLRVAADNSGSAMVVTIVPSDEVPHHRIIEVMNACAIANVKNISFNLGT
jgi:biopolymer transport protein ExbD